MGIMEARTTQISLLPLMILTIISLIVSIYLTLQHFKPPDEASLCDVDERFSCSAIRNSAWAWLFNVPIAILGICYNMFFLLTLCLAQNAVSSSSIKSARAMVVPWMAAVLLLALVGVFFVFYLLFAELMVGAICPACTIIHIIVFLSFFIAARLYMKADPSCGLASLLSKPADNLITAVFYTSKIDLISIWFVCGVLIFVPPLVYYNLVPGARDVAGGGILAQATNSDAAERFSKCITSKGWIMYGLSTCGTCQRQKQLFGSAFAHINFIDCVIPENNEKYCTDRGFSGWPSWVFSDNGDESIKWTGFASVEILEAMTLCDLERK